MTDAAPVSSRHVRLKLHNLVNIPEIVIERLEITTAITAWDRAHTTVQRPDAGPRLDLQEKWDAETLAALRYLEGADSSVVMTMGRTFEVEWDGVCRPI